MKQVQWLLLIGGAAMLAYCGFVWIDALVFDQAERELFVVQGNTPASIALASPGSIGRLEIPRLGVSAAVAEGTSGKTLRRAVGHIAGTGFPGKPGNVGIAGHRDTFFRPLRNIRRNDIILLSTVSGEYRYEVMSTRIVSPSEVEVLAPSKTEILTLVTCYPFYMIGAAPDRFIVRAKRIS